MPGTRGSNRSNPGHFKNIITRGWTWEEGLDSLERVAAHDAVALKLGVDVEAPDVGHGVSHATEPSRPCVVVNGATAVQTGARLSISGSDHLNFEKLACSISTANRLKNLLVKNLLTSAKR